MAQPMILELLSNLKTRVATNEVNIAANTSAINTNKGILDTHMADDVRHWTTADRQNFDRVIHFKGYYSTVAKLKEAYPKGQVGDYAIVGATDTVWAWDDTTNSWLNTTEQGIVISVNGRIGEVVLTKTDVGLSNVDNTSDANKPISTAQQTALNAKADRKAITMSEADSLSLRAGIYYIDGASKTILEHTDSYWTVIVGEQKSSNKSATQIWIPYSTREGVPPKMFFRRQVSQSSWTAFVEVLTSEHLSILNNTISIMNTSISQNTTNIATNATNIGTNKANIEKNAKAIADNKTAADAAIKTNSDNIATNAANIATNTTDIATNKANIATNKANIASNRTDIDSLSTNKANRLPVADKNLLDGFSLRAGTYELSMTEEYTILGESSKNWSVIIGEFQSQSSATQIWMPYEYVNSAVPKMFIRRRTSATTWSDFVEVITSNIITRNEITRVKQYKGYYATLVDLRTALPTAINGDYAIVGNAIYVWDGNKNNWSEISGGAGSGGTGKWSLKKYRTNISQAIVPDLKYLVGKEFIKQREFDDTAEEIFRDLEEDRCLYLLETSVKIAKGNAFPIPLNMMEWNTGINVYVNGISIFSTEKSRQSYGEVPATMQLKDGWNQIQIVIFDLREDCFFKLGRQITSFINCEQLDCYHICDTSINNVYVPLEGDSTINGTIETTHNLIADENVIAKGYVGVTENAHIQYNASDKSISFVFN